MPSQGQSGSVQAVAIGALIAVVAAVIVVDGVQRRGDVFADRGDGSQATRPVGTTIWYGITIPEEGATGSVTLDGARAVVDQGEPLADITFRVCQVARGRGVSAVGSVTDLGEVCADVDPVPGTTLELDRRPLEQVVMGLALERPGRVRVTGVQLEYARGADDLEQTVAVQVTQRAGRSS